MSSNARNRGTAVVALAALLGATLGFAGSGASATTVTTSLAVDCENPPEEEIYWVPVDGTVTVELTNCLEYAVIDDETDAIIDNDSGDPATLTLSGGVSLEVTDLITADIVWDGTFNKVFPETVPSGQLLLTETLDLPLDAPEMNVGPPNAPDESDDEHLLGGLEDCDLETGDTGLHIYDTLEVRVLESGEYTFRGVGTDPLSDYLSSLNPDSPIGDPFLALYSTFDPANPDDNVIGCNDDLNDFYEDYGDEMAEQLPNDVLMEGHQPIFSANLEPGVYTVVLTLYDEVENPDWWTERGPGSVTFEMWGPEGGLCKASDPACQPAPEPGPAPEPDVVSPKYTG